MEGQRGGGEGRMCLSKCVCVRVCEGGSNIPPALWWCCGDPGSDTGR